MGLGGILGILAMVIVLGLPFENADALVVNPPRKPRELPDMEKPRDLEKKEKVLEMKKADLKRSGRRDRSC